MSFGKFGLGRKVGLALSVAGLCVMSTGVAFAQSTANPAEIVGVCEVEPDYFSGNCPPTVDEQFSALVSAGVGGDQLNLSVADTAVALAERGQEAAAEQDIPLCIDLAEGIVQTAAFSTDDVQRESVIELARFSCCAQIIGTDYGLFAGTTIELTISGTQDDGDISSGNLEFVSPGAAFLSDGVRAGDILVITSGDDQGFYDIGLVTGENTLELRQGGTVAFSGWGSTASGVTYEVRRPEASSEEAQCEPGFSTAAVQIIPPVSASPN